MPDALHALSPLDGRYQSTTAPLTPFFSEFGLIKYRVKVEVEYFIALSEAGLPQLPPLDASLVAKLRALVTEFSTADAEAIKDIEKVTNHDVKAVEYFLKNAFDQLGLSKQSEFIHFGLTSQDINNTAVPLSLKDFHSVVLTPALKALLADFNQQAAAWKDIPLLARTHGQSASPTRLGKEWTVFISRLNAQIDSLNSIPFAAKFGGATGGFNAHHAAYPNHDWHAFGYAFVEGVLGLKRSYPTTQIEHYDHLAAYCDAIKRINSILIDFSRDVWTYVSMDYFKQKIKAGEVGSSAMPHKVNPIDFENAEGNLGLSTAILEHLAAKLPISRLQRDLTDSTVLRNLGVPLGHTMLALKSLSKGMNKLIVNESAIATDLQNNWVVLAEAIQTILRREGFPKPYEALKDLTRTNSKINEASLADFVDGLNVSDAVKAELKALRPETYLGQA